MHQRDYFDLMWFPDQEENSIILFPMYFELEFILTTLKSLSLESEQNIEFTLVLEPTGTM